MYDVLKYTLGVLLMKRLTQVMSINFIQKNIQICCRKDSFALRATNVDLHLAKSCLLMFACELPTYLADAQLSTFIVINNLLTYYLCIYIYYIVILRLISGIMQMIMVSYASYGC